MTIKELIAASNLVVLRSSANHRALNVSFTEEGLSYTLDSKGSFSFFKNAWVSRLNGYLVFKGDTRLSNKVYVEKFIPRDFLTCEKQLNADGKEVEVCTGPVNLHKAECTFMNKALRLLTYNAPEHQQTRRSWE